MRCILNASSNQILIGSLRCISTTAMCRKHIKEIEWDDIGSTSFKERRKELALKDPVFAYQGENTASLIHTLNLLDEFSTSVLIQEFVY